jgi:hypothetical protein
MQVFPGLQSLGSQAAGVGGGELEQPKAIVARPRADARAARAMRAREA